MAGVVSVDVQRHAVRARLTGGWALQPCANMASAAELFDRLRARDPMLTVQRIQGGRVVETTRPTVA